MHKAGRFLRRRSSRNPGLLGCGRLRRFGRRLLRHLGRRLLRHFGRRLLRHLGRGFLRHLGRGLLRRLRRGLLRRLRRGLLRRLRRRLLRRLRRGLLRRLRRGLLRRLRRRLLRRLRRRLLRRLRRCLFLLLLLRRFHDLYDRFLAFCERSNRPCRHGRYQHAHAEHQRQHSSEHSYPSTAEIAFRRRPVKVQSPNIHSYYIVGFSVFQPTLAIFLRFLPVLMASAGHCQYPSVSPSTQKKGALRLPAL